MSNYQSVAVSDLWNFSETTQQEFWQQWQEYRDSLYRCCIKWMGGNLTDAEDALSRAMLKAWEKVQKFEGKIANFKAWLIRLTHNLCIDIHRERSCGANRVENIEMIPEVQALLSFEDTPLCAIEKDEKRIAIRHAIDNLPTRLRETFILHFYRELSYPEIVQQQNISYQNVYKRISQARAILREELRVYFIGEDRSDTDLTVTPTLAETESTIREKYQVNAGVETILGETVTLSLVVEEVESIVGGEAQEIAISVQHSKSATVTAIFEGKAEIKSYGCRCVEAVQRMQQQSEMWEEWGDFLRSSRSLPLYHFPYFQSLIKSLSETIRRKKVPENDHSNRRNIDYLGVRIAIGANSDGEKRRAKMQC